MDATQWTTAGLWLAVVLSGVYHGVSPGMGWPLAVAAGLMGRGRRDLFAAMGPLASGHMLAMLAVLLPFTLMIPLVDWQREIRIGAGCLVVAFGVFRLARRRHPRALARIRPTQLGLWSFAIAWAHGATLMLVPIYLGICAPDELDAAHMASATLMARGVATALAVSLVHTGAMIVAAGAMALAVHAWLGPAFISRAWLNLDLVWALSLILIGGVAVVTAA